MYICWTKKKKEGGWNKGALLHSYIHYVCIHSLPSIYPPTYIFSRMHQIAIPFLLSIAYSTQTTHYKKCLL